MSSAAIIQSFWHGRPLSKVEILCVQSFLDHGHAFRVYAYDDVKGLPAGAQTADAEEIVPRSRLFVNTTTGFGRGSPSPFSDLFRMTLLARKGGWWTDMDVVCLRPWNITQELVIASSDEHRWGVCPNANVLRSPPGHPFAMQAAELLSARDPTAARHADGPHTVQKLVRDLELSDHVVPPWWFNPVQWRYTRYLLQPEEPLLHPRRLKRALRLTEPLGRVRPESYAVHLWGEVWTNSGYDRNGAYPANCLFEQLKRRHRIA
jgi:hypothetical protein